MNNLKQTKMVPDQLPRPQYGMDSLHLDNLLKIVEEDIEIKLTDQPDPCFEGVGFPKKVSLHPEESPHYTRTLNYIRMAREALAQTYPTNRKKN